MISWQQTQVRTSSISSPASMAKSFFGFSSLIGVTNGNSSCSEIFHWWRQRRFIVTAAYRWEKLDESTDNSRAECLNGVDRRMINWYDPLPSSKGHIGWGEFDRVERCSGISTWNATSIWAVDQLFNFICHILSSFVSLRKTKWITSPDFNWTR